MTPYDGSQLIRQINALTVTISVLEAEAPDAVDSVTQVRDRLRQRYNTWASQQRAAAQARMRPLAPGEEVELHGK